MGNNIILYINVHRNIFRLVILEDDKVINIEGEVIAMEMLEDEDEVILGCNVMGVFGLTEGMKTMKQPSTMRLELAKSGASHNFIGP